MLPVFHLVSEYFWLLCLAIGSLNCLRARKALPRDADGQVNAVAASYLTLLAIGTNGPWLVMGLGQLVGSTPTVWHYFPSRHGNPFVVIWLVNIFLATGIYAWWVFFANGAEQVRELNLLAVLGQNTRKPPSERMIKLGAFLGLLMVPAWVLLAVF